MGNFESLINELREATGISELRPADNGVVELLFDERIPVFLQPDRDQQYLSIYATVGLVEETVPGPLMLELLTASLFGRETGGASFAMEETLGQIVLQRTERLDGWSYREFEQVLLRFIDSAEAWMNRLAPDFAAGDDQRIPLSSPENTDQDRLRV